VCLRDAGGPSSCLYDIHAHRRHPPDAHEIEKLLHSVLLFPERCHLVGVYTLGKCQRLIALLRAAGYEEPVYLHGALLSLTELYRSFGIEFGPVRHATGAEPGELRGHIILAPPGALGDRWTRRLPDPVIALASGWMRVKERAKARGVELPLVISDHADWDELTATIDEVGAPEIWVTHGREEALVHYATKRGLAARALHVGGFGDEEE
jgi:putative mRNA 3-end processing factor